MFNLTQKSKLLCPMHQKLVKYINIGKECQFDQRIGCSSCMGSDFIDFELVEELLLKLLQGDIKNDQKQQLSIDFIRHIELFQQQINCLLDQMKKCSDFIHKQQKTVTDWLLQIKNKDLIESKDLKEIATKLSKLIIRDNQQIDLKMSSLWEENLRKYSQIMQSLSIQISQIIHLKNITPQQEEPQVFLIEQQLKNQIQLYQNNEQQYLEQIEQMNKKIQFFEDQLKKTEQEYDKVNLSLEKLKMETKQQTEKQTIQQDTKDTNDTNDTKYTKDQQQSNEIKQIKDKFNIPNKCLQKFQTAELIDHKFWKEFNKELTEINQQIGWLQLKFCETLTEYINKQKQFDSKSFQLEENNQQFTTFYLNQQIAQLQSINKLLLDSQIMFKGENVELQNNLQDPQELKQKIKETVTYIINHKQHYDICQLEMKYLQQLMIIKKQTKNRIINSRDLQKYFQRLADKNKFGLFYINNNVLLKNTKSLQQVKVKDLNDDQLKENLTIEKDYCLINEFAWKFIQELYFSSGPEIVIIGNK